ncbi:MAG TPA: methylated-DNA--[protein]-cysteine S-methyltransferase [Ornithinibacter sp.]|nr:methylated-DNA--[protein]-cysteine S-methyltransferase [Ornithinibacter sp.]
MTRSVVTASPIGRLELVEAGGALVAIHFDAPADGSPEHERGGSALLAEARRQLAAYFAGELREFDLPLRPAGTDFQRRVWAVLATVPWGATTTYGAIAARLGLPPGASRAVGAANGANPIPVVLPCHRVIGADGALTGYAGGLERKAVLLRLEHVATEADQAPLF